MINQIKLFLIALVFFMASPPQAQEPRFDRSVEKILKDFFEGHSMQEMEEQMRKMMEEMESSFSSGGLRLLEDESLNQLLRDSGLFIELDHGQHEWIESEKERILVLKLETKKDTPIDIKIENGQIIVSAKIEKEVVNQTQFGESRSVSVQHYNRVFLVPEDCDANSVNIENKGGEVLIKFAKRTPSSPKAAPERAPKKAPEAAPSEKSPLEKPEDAITI